MVATSTTTRLDDPRCGAADSIGRGRAEPTDRAAGAHVPIAVSRTESHSEPQDGKSSSPAASREMDATGTGQGARVEVVGGWRAGPRPPTTARQCIVPAAAPGDNLAGVRILFVDDDELVRRVVGAMLERLRVAATVVSSPLEALRLVREDADRFDILVTDLTMPEMSGHQLFFHVRELSPTLPVLLASGDSFDTKIKACLEQGARGFLAKPFTIAGLAQAIQEACDPGPLRR